MTDEQKYIACCASCLHRIKHRCHFYAPQGAHFTSGPLKGLTVRFEWPTIDLTDRCGQYREHPDEKMWISRETWEEMTGDQDDSSDK